MKLMLAHSWNPDQDPAGWWMSEKLDGVRAHWDGQTFHSRGGHTFAAPPWFTKDLPDIHLDGEIWGGNGAFDKTSGIVRSHDGGARWMDLLYVVFDAPLAAGVFEDRMLHAQLKLALKSSMRAHWHPHIRCDGADHLTSELKRVESLGGEGMMLRRPGSAYEGRRSGSLLKVKSFHDAEAVVVGHENGAGKHAGRLGALVCQLANGTRFKVGTGFSDAQREAPPPAGAVITFAYFELTKNGVPRFPSYVGVSADKGIEP